MKPKVGELWWVKSSSVEGTSLGRVFKAYLTEVVSELDGQHILVRFLSKYMADTGYILYPDNFLFRHIGFFERLRNWWNS